MPLSVTAPMMPATRSRDRRCPRRWGCRRSRPNRRRLRPGPGALSGCRCPARPPWPSPWQRMPRREGTALPRPARRPTPGKITRPPLWSNHYRKRRAECLTAWAQLMEVQEAERCPDLPVPPRSGRLCSCRPPPSRNAGTPGPVAGGSLRREGRTVPVREQDLNVRLRCGDHVSGGPGAGRGVSRRRTSARRARSSTSSACAPSRVRAIHVRGRRPA